MFGIGTEELLLIIFIALLVLGPERMPKLARDLGKFVGDMRRTSDELREEFLNADRVLERAANLDAATKEKEAAEAATALPATVAPAPVGAAAVEPAVPDAGGSVPDAGATQAAVVPPVADASDEAPQSEVETAFDREAREARERLSDPERTKRAAAEGWKVPTDEAGTSDRWG